MELQKTFLRLALVATIAAALNASCHTALCDEDFDSLINLELAFRDEIMDKPAPQRYESLIRLGETTISFVRELPDTVGKTDFFLTWSWTYNYRYTTRTVGPATEVSVTPIDVKVVPRLRHLIRMPLAAYHAEVWESRLLGHEFDHVAVSLDPRPQLLLIHLCNELPTRRFLIAPETKPSEQQLRAVIDGEMRRRLSAVLELVKANYQALDKASQHGHLAMPDRRAFFSSLYTSANLEAAKFPFRRDVASLLKSESYRERTPVHVGTSPTTRPVR